MTTPNHNWQRFKAIYDNLPTSADRITFRGYFLGYLSSLVSEQQWNQALEATIRDGGKAKAA